MKKYLIDKSKTMDQILDLIKIDEMALHDKIKCLSVIKDEHLLTQELVETIKKREDKISHYIKGLESPNEDLETKMYALERHDP